MDATQPAKTKHEQLGVSLPEETTNKHQPAWISWNIFGPVVALTVATLLAYVLTWLPDPYTSNDYTNIALIYLVATVFSAVNWGLVASLVTTVSGFTLYHFYFRAPAFSLELAPYELVSLFVFVSASMVAVLIGARSKRRLEEARERKRTITAFSKLYEDLMLCESEEKVVETLGQQLSGIIESRIYLFLPDEEETLRLAYPHDGCTDEYVHEAKRVFTTGTPTPPNLKKGLPFFYAVTMPYNTEEKKQGVLGIEITHWTPHTSNTAFIHSLADQASLALDRAQLAQTLQKERSQKEREELRSALLASVTHDLKTPLASVIGSLSSLRHMDALNNEARKKLIITAHDEAGRLNDFISNILHMTKLKSGAIELEKDWHNPAAIVRRVTRRLQNRLQHHSVDIRMPDHAFQFYLDAMLVEQVIQNLLDNAVKYGTPASTITVDIHMNDAGSGIVSVSNEGPPIAKSHRRKLFDKFYRASKRDNTVAGTGLGLAICQAIMDIHGGVISVSEAQPSSQEPGTVFTLSFPEAKLKPEEQAA